MRHRKKGKRLGRPMGHRKALMKNLTKQLLEHGRIQTTTVKAKLLKAMVEPLVTKAKNGTVHDRREVMKVIGGNASSERGLIKKLFTELAPIYADRKGGYTRVLKLKNRPGDNAEISIIEFVEKEKVYKKAEPETKGKGKKGKKEKEEGESKDKGKEKEKGKEKDGVKKEKPAKEIKQKKAGKTPAKKAVRKTDTKNK